MDLLQQYQKAVQCKIDRLNKTNTKVLKDINPIRQKLESKHKKRSNSLLSIFNEIKYKQNKQQMILTKQNFGSTKFMKDAHKTIVIDNGMKGQRVTNTINSINQYSHHLRLTLLNQYHHYRNGCARNNSLNEIFRDQKVQNKEEQLKPKKQANKSPKNKAKNKNSLNNKSTYQTLNILYKAIIDGSFKKRQKSAFVIEATHLPIIARSKSKRQQGFSELYKEYTHNLYNNQIKHHNINFPQKHMKQSQYNHAIKDNIPRKTFLNTFRQKPLNKQTKQQFIINAWNIDQQINIE